VVAPCNLQDDGHFVLHGRCVALCPTPPTLPNAIAVYNNTLAKTGAVFQRESSCFEGLEYSFIQEKAGLNFLRFVCFLCAELMQAYAGPVA